MQERLEALERRLGQVEEEAARSREEAARCRAELGALRRRARLTGALGLAAAVVGLTFAAARPGETQATGFTPLTLRNPFTRTVAMQVVGSREGTTLNLFGPTGAKAVTLVARSTGGELHLFEGSTATRLAVLGRQGGGFPGSAITRGLTLFSGGEETLFVGNRSQGSTATTENKITLNAPFQPEPVIALSASRTLFEDSRGLSITAADGLAVELGARDPDDRGLAIVDRTTDRLLAGVVARRTVEGARYGQVLTFTDTPPSLLFASPAPP